MLEKLLPKDELPENALPFDPLLNEPPKELLGVIEPLLLNELLLPLKVEPEAKFDVPLLNCVPNEVVGSDRKSDENDDADDSKLLLPYAEPGVLL